MSTLPMADLQNPSPSEPSQHGTPTFAICLPAMSPEAQGSVLQRLEVAFPQEPLLIATPLQLNEAIPESGRMRLVPYEEQARSSEWVLDASDYAAAARLAEKHQLSGVLLLGPDAETVESAELASMREMLAGGIDLCVPRPRVGPQEGLVNSAVLYPMTRALFSVNVRFPLPLDAALSRRMLSRIAQPQGRAAATSETSLVWPVADAAIAGFSVREVEGGMRLLQRPQETDLNVLFPSVCASLFADVESKATYWQRARTLSPARPRIAPPDAAPPADPAEVQALVEGFRLAFANLREIWSLVLPPQTLLPLKKLSLSPVEAFSLAPALWARIVYDFALAFHLRTINRGHLLGSMTPLYLAWVAGLLRSSAEPGAAGALLESTASAFEQEKPYLVSRWRWPDRFNP